MASLTDYTYFLKRENKIPNLNTPVATTNLQDYIDTYEEEYMIKVMGLPLYNEFKSGLGEDPILDKWVDLRDGVEFEYNDCSYKWNGFNNARKISPAANYIFFYSVRDEDIINSGIGSIKSRAENADRVMPNDKLSLSWNNMVKLNEVLRYLLLSDTDSYSLYDPNNTLTEGIYLNGI